MTSSCGTDAASQWRPRHAGVGARRHSDSQWRQSSSPAPLTAMASSGLNCLGAGSSGCAGRYGTAGGRGLLGCYTRSPMGSKALLLPPQHEAPGRPPRRRPPMAWALRQHCSGTQSGHHCVLAQSASERLPLYPGGSHIPSHAGRRVQ